MSDGEKCVKCGEVGEDRRTLWHSCFYAMDELGLPFEQVCVKGETFSYQGQKPIHIAAGMPPVNVSSFEETPSGKVDCVFFTLRVCKGCRSDWLEAIKKWFAATPERLDKVSSGIWIRENGVSKQITEEEWHRRYAERGNR